MDNPDELNKDREELKDLIRQKVEMTSKLYDLETEIHRMEKEYLSSSSLLSHLFRGLGAPTDPRTGRPIEGGMFTLSSLTFISRILQKISKDVEEQVERRAKDDSDAAEEVEEISDSEPENDNVVPVISTLATTPLFSHPEVNEPIEISSTTKQSHGHRRPSARSLHKKKHSRNSSKRHKHQEVMKKTTASDLAFDALLESASYDNGKESKTASEKSESELRLNIKQHLKIIQQQHIGQHSQKVSAAQGSTKKRKHEDNIKVCNPTGIESISKSFNRSSEKKAVRQYVPKPKINPPEPPRPASWALQTYAKPGPSGVKKTGSFINKNEIDSAIKPDNTRPTEVIIKKSSDLKNKPASGKTSINHPVTRIIKKAKSTKNEGHKKEFTKDAFKHTFAEPIATTSTVASDYKGSTNPVLHKNKIIASMAAESSEFHSPATFTYKIPETELQASHAGTSSTIFTPGMVINMPAASGIHTLTQVQSDGSPITTPLTTPSAVVPAESPQQVKPTIEKILGNLFFQQSAEGIRHLVLPPGLQAFSMKGPDGEHIVIKIPAATSDQVGVPQYLIAKPRAASAECQQPVEIATEATLPDENPPESI